MVTTKDSKNDTYRWWKSLSLKAKILWVIIPLFLVGYLIPWWNRMNVLYYSDFAIYLIWLGIFPLFTIYLLYSVKEKTLAGKFGIVTICIILSFLCLIYLGMGMDYFNQKPITLKATFKERLTQKMSTSANQGATWLCPQEAVLLTAKEKTYKLCYNHITQDITKEVTEHKSLVHYGPVILTGRSSVFGIVVDRIELNK